jgi:hypothetical protein
MTQLPTRPAADRRLQLAALLLAVPAIITALSVIALEAWRWMSPDSALFARPAAATLADAIAANDARGAYEFIRGGQNPNDAIAVRHEVLTAGESVTVPPLLWAVATQSENAVAMLLAFGARLDASAKHRAICLAAHLGRGDIVELIQLSGADDATDACPAVGATGQRALLLPTP